MRKRERRERRERERKRKRERERRERWGRGGGAVSPHKEFEGFILLLCFKLGSFYLLSFSCFGLR